MANEKLDDETKQYISDRTQKLLNVDTKTQKRVKMYDDVLWKKNSDFIEAAQETLWSAFLSEKEDFQTMLLGSSKGLKMCEKRQADALEKMEEDPLDNVHFIRMDAEYINQVFDKGEVEEIYLNFSDPWPKDRHAKRRLTSRQFLARYKNIIRENQSVIFKTDNRDLFDFSLEEVKEAGWKLDLCTFDLHHSEYLEGNVMTEYEEKFVKKGNPICKMIIHYE